MARDRPVRDQAIPNYGLSEGESIARDRPSHYGEIVHSFKP